MNPIPILYGNREMSFDPDTLEKLKYINFKRKGKPGRYSDIVSEALKEFFDVKFKELKIEHYVDVKAEADKKRWEKMQEEQARERENRRLLQLAKLRIMENEIERIKKEEEKTGKKIELPADIGRRLGNYRI